VGDEGDCRARRAAIVRTRRGCSYAASRACVGRFRSAWSAR
jgi:hypothetical protein